MDEIPKSIFQGWGVRLSGLLGTGRIKSGGGGIGNHSPRLEVRIGYYSNPSTKACLSTTNSGEGRTLLKS